MYAYLVKLFVALVFVLHGTAPATTHVIVDNNRIVGGIDASHVDTGFMVYLIIPIQGKFFQCGGSIINEQTILTAAHCFENASVSDVEVYAGRKVFLLGHGLSVVTVHSHPDYDPKTVDNDIALVRLAAPLTFNSRIRAIKLAEAGAVHDHSWAKVFGWGKTETGHSSSVLLYTNVWVFDRKDCQSMLPTTDRMLCAGGMLLPADSCEGDSGGPLVQDDKVIGIVSFGRRKCGYPSVYTNVAALRPWVDQTLAEHYHEKL